MSYSLRNTILLAITLLLIIIGGGLWIYMNPHTEIKERTEQIKTQESKLVSMQGDAERFQAVYDINEQIKHRLDNYPKTLLPNHRLSYLYNYIRLADPGTTFMNFAYTDSTRHNDYGRIRFTIDGATDYRELRDFIQTIERATPMIKFTEIQIRPSNNDENLNEVVFRLTTEAYYDRTGRKIKPVYASLERNSNRNNPFFPLIHNIPSNEDDLINVEASNLSAMGDSFIFLTDQKGQIQRLRVRDRVYLGYLESISPENQTATFFLNKGGLTERVTLRIKQ